VLVRLLAYCGLRVGEALALPGPMLTCPWNAHGPPERGGFDRASDYCADQDLRNENHHAADPLVADLALLETATRPMRPAGMSVSGNLRVRLGCLTGGLHRGTQTCRVGR
jgi:hypothetical protein